MAESEFYHLVHAIFNALTASSEAWGTRVYDMHVPANTKYPYILMHKVGGGDTNTNATSDPRIIYAIRCVSNSLKEAYDGQKRIAELIDNQGDYDTATPLDASGGLADGTDWSIRTTQKALAIVFSEDVEHAERIYHAGNQYIFMMQSAE